MTVHKPQSCACTSAGIFVFVQNVNTHLSPQTEMYAVYLMPCVMFYSQLHITLFRGFYCTFDAL